MKTQTIAILATTAALSGAMQARLAEAFPNAEFETVSRISERSPGTEIAAMGLPSYIPGSQDVKVHNFGTKMIPNATSEDRNHQWEVARDKESTVEEVLAALGNFSTVIIKSEASVRQTKLDFSDIRIALAEAETEEQKVEAYKKSHQLLLKQLQA